MTDPSQLDPQSLPQGPPTPTPPLGSDGGAPNPIPALGSDPGLLVLICGIVGVFMPAFAFVAVALGFGPVRQARAAQQSPETKLLVGWILGLVMSALQLLLLALVLILLASFSSPGL